MNALSIIPPESGDELDISTILRLTPYQADFSQVRTFTLWEYCARKILDIGRASGFWLLDAVTHIQSAFGFSPTTGLLVFLEDVKPHLRSVYTRPTDAEVAEWLGKAPQTIYNLRQIGKLIENRTMLDGIKVSVWDFDAVLVDGLPESERRRLAREYAEAKKKGGYGVDREGAEVTEMIKATRGELRQRAKAAHKLANVDDIPQAVGKKLERHKVYGTVPVWRLRNALKALGEATDWLPTETTHDDEGNLIQRYIEIDLGGSWLQEVKPDHEKL